MHLIKINWNLINLTTEKALLYFLFFLKQLLQNNLYYNTIIMYTGTQTLDFLL